MALATYDTHTLRGVIETIKPDLSEYWLKLFPDVITFDEEFIDFDIVDTTRKLAPFVAPTVQGRVIGHRGYTTKRFKPAYVKPKDVIDPTKLIKRRAGEALATGSLSLGQRRDALVAQTLADHRAMIDRRLEWMAAQAIINSSILISGEDYPAQTISFGRDAGHTVTLTSTDLWTDAASTPYADLEEWALLIHSKTGFVVDRITLGTSAYAALKAHAHTEKLLDTTLAGSSVLIDRGPRMDGNAKYVGRIGTVEVWVYADVYDSDAGVATAILPADSVVLTARGGIGGVRCFGAILDKSNGYQPAVYFPKMWEQEDPSVEYLMTQSAPLMVVSRANTTLKAKVV